MNLGKTYSKDDRSNKSPTFLNIQRLLVRWLPSQPSKVLRDRDTIEAFFHATNWQEPWTKSESICAWNRDEEWKTSILGHLGWIAMSKEGGARASGCFSRGNILSLTERKTVMSPSIFRSKMKNKIEKKRKKGEDRLADKSCDERVWNTWSLDERKVPFPFPSSFFFFFNLSSFSHVSVARDSQKGWELYVYREQKSLPWIIIGRNETDKTGRGGRGQFRPNSMKIESFLYLFSFLLFATLS